MEETLKTHSNPANANIVLVTVIGQRVQHTEQKYIGIIKDDAQNGYCKVDLEDEYLKSLYPFGIRALVTKLVLLL